MNIVMGLGLTGIVFVILTIIWAIWVGIYSKGIDWRSWHNKLSWLLLGFTAAIFIAAIWLGVIIR